jgi:signal transduction histidine kinase
MSCASFPPNGLGGLSLDEEYYLKSSFIRLVLAAVFATYTNWAFTAEKSTEADAMFLIQKAQDYLKKNGLEKSIVEFNRLDSPFNTFSDINKKGDLYLYTVDSKGYQAVHGKNPKIRGKIMLEMRDIDGIFLIKNFIALCFESKEGKGWTNYHWPNPITNEVEAKRGYVEKVPGSDFCLGTGIYK